VRHGLLGKVQKKNARKSANRPPSCPRFNTMDLNLTGDDDDDGDEAMAAAAVAEGEAAPACLREQGLSVRACLSA
jgi:hypothetical protein